MAEHGHEHGGAGHSHAPSANADRSRLAAALAIIATFMVVEIVAGLIADSIALLSDAAHMATDAASIALALLAARLAARPSSGTFTFGLRRAEILSAQINGASLLVLGAILGYEAIGRMVDPPDVEGGLVIVVGVIGGLANVLAAWMLARSERRSLNVEGAMQHVLADLYGSAAAVTSGVFIVVAGFERADPIAALVVVILMFRSGWRLVRDSGRILLEAAPEGMNAEEIGGAMSAQPGVVEVHDLHVWEVTSDFPALSAHVLVPVDVDCHACRRELEAMLDSRFGIAHTTIQVDHQPPDELLEISDARSR